jgi:hypothetical protein
MSDLYKKLSREGWQQTDADSNQYGRKLKGNRYEFREEVMNPIFDNYGEIIQFEVDLNEYLPEEIENHCSAYGGVDEINEQYGEQANFIIAECIFEQESGLY